MDVRASSQTVELFRCTSEAETATSYEEVWIALAKVLKSKVSGIHVRALAHKLTREVDSC